MKKSETAAEGTTVISDVSCDNSHGPALFQRDEHGLLKNVQYVFNEDGSVDWRAMIKEDQLFPNKSWFESRKKSIPRSAEGLGDNQLLIKLGGIKELARLRGFDSVSYETVKCEFNHVAVICRMNFIPNFETNDNPVVFQDMANATHENTSSFATKFLETIACNRAFVRCVRNFLNIHIVGDDEIDKSDPSGTPAAQGNPLSPSSILETQAKTKWGCVSFDDFRETLRTLWQREKYRNPEVKNWKEWGDIPAKEIRKLLAVINES